MNHYATWTEEDVKARNAQTKLGGRLPLSREKEPQSGTLAFTLPVPPTTNLAYVQVKGRRVLTKAARDFKRHATIEAENQAFVRNWEYRSGERLSLTLRLVFPNGQRRDISNCVKLVEDSIATALGFDDSKVDRLVVERLGIDKANPRCEVTVGIMEAE